MKPVIMWDFDGTLENHEGRWRGAVLRALGEVCPEHEFSAAQIDESLHTGFPWHAPEREHHEWTRQGAWWRHMCAVLAGKFAAMGLSDRVAEDAAQRTRAQFLDLTYHRAFAGTQELLAALAGKGWRQIILSNHVPELPDLVRGLGLDAHMEMCLTSADMGVEKPNLRAFEYAMERLGQRDHIVMIGDNPRADAYGALRAGIDAILLRTEAGDPGICRAADLGELEVMLDALMERWQ